MFVTNICVEHCFQVGWIANLPVVHRTNSFFHRHHLIEIDFRMSLKNCFLDRLNLIIQRLNFISTSLIQILVKEWHIFFLEHFAALLWIFFKETCDTTWVNDLVAWTKCQVQERWNGHTWHEERLRKCIANVVYVFNGKSCGIQRLFGSNNPDVAPIVDNFANEWDILKTENRELQISDRLLSKYVARLPVKRSLTKHWSNNGSFL